MPINKKHYLPNKSDREVEAKFHPIYKMACPNKKNFDRVEEVLDAVVCDIINGKSKSDIYFKLKSGEYPNMKKGLADPTINEYYAAAMSRLRYDREEKEEALKDKLFAMYENLYNEAMEGGENMQAKAILDSIVKMAGLDKPKTAIQINNTEKDGLTINFGFTNGD